MRTTVELSDEHYVALRTLAARRGMRGFSTLIEEAVELLVSREQDHAIDAALALAGTLDEDEARHLDERVHELRSRPARYDEAAGGREMA